MYKGVSATIMKQGSNQAIRFFVMESLRDWYKGGDRDKHVPKYIVGLFGGIAGKYMTIYLTTVTAYSTYLICWKPNGALFSRNIFSKLKKMY